MLSEIRKLLLKYNLDAILVNSTNEYLVEYNSLEENSRYKLTGFTGSTGDAVVTCDKVYLFVDGRYHIQADNEVNPDIVTVVKLHSGDTFFSKFKEIFSPSAVLGLFPSKNSISRIDNFKKFCKVVYLEQDPFDKKVSVGNTSETEIPVSIAGRSVEDKLQYLRRNLNVDDAILVSNLEEVSYLFNLRDFSKQYSSKVEKRAIITNESANLYGRADFDNYKSELLSISGNIYVDKTSINGRDFDIVKDKAKIMDLSPISILKSEKTSEEIKHYMSAFKRTDDAMRAIRAFINDNDNISEYDVDKKLEEYFYKYGAKSLSFKSIVAKDNNSALAHYSKSSKEEVIKEGSLVLIDCGAYYEGGLATDITRVFVKGAANPLQRKVYTTVLKAFLNAFNTQVTSDTSGYDIDNKTRLFFNKNAIEGFEFNHGLGHGIGISVHEYPPNLGCSELSKVKLKDNMCFTIEPGLYNKNEFGVRLENSCYLKDGIIHSFTNMNYEKKLINFDMLTPQELEWLKSFEVI